MSFKFNHNFLSFFVIVAVLGFSVIQAYALTFTENSNPTFSGTKVNTVWTGGGTSAIQLNAAGRAAQTGTYTSAVKNFGDLTSWNSIAWTPFAPHSKEIPNNGLTETVYPNQNLTNTNSLLLAHLNETSGTTFTDNSGNGNNGTCPGTISPTPPSIPTCPTLGSTGVFNTADTFSATSPGNLIGFNPTAVNTITNRYTVTAWAKLNSFPVNDHAPIVWKGDKLYDGSYAFRIATFGTNSFTFGSNISGTQYFTNGVGTFSTGQWYNLTLVYTGSNVIGYINGTQVTSIAVSPTNANVDMFPTKNVMLGWAWRSDQVSDITTFDGQIDEVGIWGRSFSATEVLNLYRRGIFRIKHQVRSCGVAACTGVNFVGPDGTSGTFYTDTQTGNNTLPTIPITGISNGQYFQYRTTLETDDTALTPGLRIVTVDYTLIVTPSIAIVIRNSSDTANTNVCDLGTATSTTFSTCSYRIKVTANGSGGYVVYVTTSGGLTEGSYTVSDAAVGSGGSGGDLINGTTVGTEKYGVFITAGSITGAGGISRSTLYNAGSTNSVKFNTASPEAILTAAGTNAPGATDTTNTSLITHNLNISDVTVGGNYAQTITYTVVGSF